MCEAENDNNSVEIVEEDEDSHVDKALEALEGKLEAIRKSLEPLCATDLYGSLSTDDRVKHDLFLSYALTSLYWIYLKTVGVDPKENVAGSEIDRLKEYIGRARLIKERKTMPRLDKEATRRFVNSGLWTPGQPKRSNKRKRFAENDD